MAYASEIFNPGRTLGERVDGVRRLIDEKRAEKRAYRRTFNELHRLSERELADLGMCRADIPSIAYDAAKEVR